MAKTRRNQKKRGGTTTPRILGKYEAHIDAIDDDTGERPIFTHVKANKFKKVKILIDDGANLDYEDDTRNSLMHYAAKFEDDDVEILEYIIKNSNPRDLRAAVKGINDRNQTPLHLAAEAGNAKAAKLLVENGADMFALNDELQSPVGVAKYYDNEETVDAIKKADLEFQKRKARQRGGKKSRKARSHSRSRSRSGGKKNKKGGKTRKH